MPSNKYTQLLRVMTFFTLISLSIIVSPKAFADYEKITGISHEFFDVETALRQKNTSSRSVVEGYLEFSLKFSNMRPRFNPNIVSEEFSCIGQPRAQWDTYYTLHHNIDLTSSDYVGNSSGPSRSGRWTRILITVKLSQNGTPLFNSSNPNFEIAFDEKNTRAEISQEMRLREKFTLDGQQLIGKSFEFPVYGGEEFVVEQDTYATQYFTCGTGISGGHKLGKRIEQSTSLIVEKKSQEITAQVPTQTDFANKAERISFSSSSKLPVMAIEKTPNTCIVDRDMVYLRSIGVCIIEFSQAGNASFLPAQTVLREMRVVATSTPSPSPKVSSKLPSIKCVKGKSTLMVIGKNPKCPTGYKKK